MITTIKYDFFYLSSYYGFLKNYLTLLIIGSHIVFISIIGLLRDNPSGGFRFNLNCRQVIIQEYLTLVPTYG